MFADFSLIFADLCKLSQMFADFSTCLQMFADFLRFTADFEAVLLFMLIYEDADSAAETPIWGWPGTALRAQ